MFEISKMMQRVKDSERSQRKMVIPEGTIRLDRGEPDFCTPDHIKEAAIRAIRNDFTFYANPYGDPELREAICFGLRRDYAVERKRENVLITAGGIEAVNIIMATYLNPDDEVLLMEPEYSGYGDSVRFFGGKPVHIPLMDNFRLDLKAIEGRITNKTKMIFLSNPGNPTGHVKKEEEMREIARIALNYNLLLIVDEVYGKLVYEGARHFSICQIEEIKDRSILLNSFSKTYAMTGWRVGYLVADDRVINDLVMPHRTLLIGVNTPAQKACVAAITGPQDCVESMRKEYEKRKNLVDQILQGIEKILTNPCEGAFYFFPRFDHQMNSREMTNYLFENGILVRSGTEFGAKGEKHIRITFSVSKGQLVEGMERLRKALEQLE